MKLLVNRLQRKSKKVVISSVDSAHERIKEVAEENAIKKEENSINFPLPFKEKKTWVDEQWKDGSSPRSYQVPERSS